MTSRIKKTEKKLVKIALIIFIIFAMVFFLSEFNKETYFYNKIGSEQATPAMRGPLRIHPGNPRYFTDDRGEAIYLTGSHNWRNFIDSGTETTLDEFDYIAYLEFLKSHHHNFIRLWKSELPSSKCGEQPETRSPFPWLRTGPGVASDGNPRFDLYKFNPIYFDRLRSRVKMAAEKGIYVSIMLFEGYGLQFCRWAQDGYPFEKGNNINQVEIEGSSAHKIDNHKVLALQESYIEEVIDSVNQFDNVLYEVANEDGAGSLEWHYHIIDFVKRYQRTKHKQHPIGMSYRYKGGTNAELFESEANFISPGVDGEINNNGSYRSDPPANDGTKVIISDTDHLWGIGGDHRWVWKSFLRGLNPIYMDPYLSNDQEHRLHPSKKYWELARVNMGYTMNFARRINLSKMVPRNDLSSTNYCLADFGNEYLIYIPSARGEGGIRHIQNSAFERYVNWVTRLTGLNESVTITFPGEAKTYSVEWLNPRTGLTIKGQVITGVKDKSLTAPFAGDAVLFLSKIN